MLPKTRPIFVGPVTEDVSAYDQLCFEAPARQREAMGLWLAKHGVRGQRAI